MLILYLAVGPKKIIGMFKQQAPGYKCEYFLEISMTAYLILSTSLR